jgi:hypothetical protein
MRAPSEWRLGCHAIARLVMKIPLGQSVSLVARFAVMQQSPVAQLTAVCVRAVLILLRVPAAATYRNSVFCPHCIYVFCIYLRQNSDLCPIRHTRIGFYNQDENFLQRGANWVFKSSGLRFVFERWYKFDKDNIMFVIQQITFLSSVDRISFCKHHNCVRTGRIAQGSCWLLLTQTQRMIINFVTCPLFRAYFSFLTFFSKSSHTCL